MTYALEARGVRWVATCDRCGQETAPLPSKVGVVERAEKHDGKCRPRVRRPSFLELYGPDFAWLSDYVIDGVGPRRRASCSHCAWTATKATHPEIWKDDMSAERLRREIQRHVMAAHLSSESSPVKPSRVVSYDDHNIPF